MVRKEIMMNSLKGLVLVLVFLVGGCNESDYIEVEVFENGESAGFLINESLGVSTYSYEGFYYKVKDQVIVQTDAEYIYENDKCETKLVKRKAVGANTLVSIEGVLYVTSNLEYKQLNGHYKIIQNTCTIFYNKIGGFYSKVLERPAPKFMRDGLLIKD